MKTDRIYKYLIVSREGSENHNLAVCIIKMET